MAPAERAAIRGTCIRRRPARSKAPTSPMPFTPPPSAPDRRPCPLLRPPGGRNGSQLPKETNKVCDPMSSFLQSADRDGRATRRYTRRLIVCPRCGMKNPRRAFLSELRLAADERFHRRGAQGRHGPVLRPGRVHGTLGPGRPRGRQGDAPRLPRAAEARRSSTSAARSTSSSATRCSACSGPRRPRGRPERASAPGCRSRTTIDEANDRAARPGARRSDRDQHRRGRGRVRRRARRSGRA